MTTSEYTVRLDAFEGPLDLLLFLIRRAEVEITQIPVAAITDQYLKYIQDIADDAGGDVGHIDIERAGEFLVMAATLMEIKSRMLTPVLSKAVAPTDAERPQGPTEDPRAELVQQLLEYKRFRDASDALDRAKRDWENKFPAGKALSPRPPKADEPEAQGPVDIDDVQLIDLVAAFARVIETVDLTRVGEHRVVMDDTPVELHAEDIIDRLTRLSAASPGVSAQIDFAKVFEGRSRSEMIGLFLAVLELVKQQRVLVKQEDGDRSGTRIVLKLAEPLPDQAATAPGPE